MKQNSHKYEIIAAVSTLAIQFVLFALLNANFEGLLALATPQNHETEEFDIPLDQIMDDLKSIETPASTAEKQAEKTEQKPDVYKQEQPTEPKLTESAAPTTDEQPDISPKEEPLKEIPPSLEKSKIVIKDSLIDSIVPAALKKMLTDQSLTKDINKKKNNNNYAQRIEFYKKNYRSIRNLIKVYPYAIRTREIIDSLNMRLAVTSNASEKKKLIGETEKMLFKNYETAVRTMTASQGRVLLKLIARETNKTGYQIIKEYKGGFSAGFWYSLGKLFNTDLKTEYHKEKEDSVYEVILQKYKDGEFK